MTTSFASRLPSFERPKTFQHSAEAIPELQQAVIDLSEMVKKLMVRMHNFENQGRDE